MKGTNYTDNGDSILSYSESEGEYWEYEYNLLNQLVTVYKSTAGTNNKSLLVYYTYDGEGYRIQRQSVNEDVSYYFSDLQGNLIYEETDEKYIEYLYVNNKLFAKTAGFNNGDGSEREKFFYHTDHLGSTILMTNEDGDAVWSDEFTTFGNRSGEIGIKHDNGFFTGKGLDYETGLYYFNARWYDPNIGRFISLDPIRDGVNWYVYAENNPILNIDPSGKFVLEALAITALFTTELGYDLQKFFSPIALTLNFNFGTEKNSVGIDVSFGIPKIIPFGARNHFGISYIWNQYDNSFTGVETREGKEVSALWILSYSFTKFDSGETSQTTYEATVGIPGFNIKVANDFDILDEFLDIKIPAFNAGTGDKYRTAAVKINLGVFSAGLLLFTGDPGNDYASVPAYIDNDSDGVPELTYTESKNNDNPDEYRVGVFYLEMFNLIRFGFNSEQIRHGSQNLLIHKNKIPDKDSVMGKRNFEHIPFFRVLDDDVFLYFQIGTGTGGTLY